MSNVRSDRGAHAVGGLRPWCCGPAGHPGLARLQGRQHCVGSLATPLPRGGLPPPPTRVGQPASLIPAPPTAWCFGLGEGMERRGVFPKLRAEPGIPLRLGGGSGDGTQACDQGCLLQVPGPWHSDRPQPGRSQAPGRVLPSEVRAARRGPCFQRPPPRVRLLRPRRPREGRGPGLWVTPSPVWWSQAPGSTSRVVS